MAPAAGGGRARQDHVTQEGSVDVLVFGPHPDDIEIGLGGTIARACRRRASASACAI